MFLLLSYNNNISNMTRICGRCITGMLKENVHKQKTGKRKNQIQHSTVGKHETNEVVCLLAVGVTNFLSMVSFVFRQATIRIGYEISIMILE